MRSPLEKVLWGLVMGWLISFVAFNGYNYYLTEKIEDLKEQMGVRLDLDIVCVIDSINYDIKISVPLATWTAISEADRDEFEARVCDIAQTSVTTEIVQ